MKRSRLHLLLACAALPLLTGCDTLALALSDSGPKTERLERHDFGGYALQVDRETSYTSNGARSGYELTLRHGRSKDPDRDLLQGAYLQRRASFLYLEQAGTLVLFYRGLSNYSGYLVATIDTRQPRFNLTPVRGTALLSRDALPGLNERLPNGARVNHNRIFWNVPDASSETMEDYCCDLKYDQRLNAFYGRAVFADAATGAVYPRNEYVYRYRLNIPMVTPYPARPGFDPGSLASDEVRRIALRKSEAPYIRSHTDIVLGMTADRSGMWFANFSDDRSKARVCYESLKSSAWQCLAFPIERFPERLAAAFGAPPGDSRNFNCSRAEGRGDTYFEEAGVGQGFQALDCRSDGSAESALAAWLAQYVELKQEAGRWLLKPAASTRILDQVRIESSQRQP